MAQLEGQVALVTGGGSGIGRAVVDRYVEEGARVCIMDISAERLAELSRLHGERVIGVQGDATTVEANERAVRQIVEKFSKLDVFVANAGLGDAFRELIDIPTADVPRVYKEIFDLNVLAVIIGARVAVKELVKTQGSIIVTLSNSSFYPDGGGVMYIASKHAALGIVRQLAHEFAPMVRVNGVSPGATKTDIRMPASFGLDERGERIRTHTHPSNKDAAVEAVTPLKMHAEPADHSGAYVLLASRRDSKAMTGTVVKSEAGLGIRGLRRVRGGDELRKRLLGQ
jgi:NAD(P)-dependent dehydrogenase (short-subunit alcohol dehydrogenase family)